MADGRRRLDKNPHHVTRAKPVVDIHDRNTWRASVQHREKRREALKRRAVADARGDGDDGCVGQPGDDARKGAVHTGDDHEHIRVRQRFLMGEQAMEPGDADVEHPLDVDAHELSRESGFLRDADVGRARGQNRRATVSLCRKLTDDDRARIGPPVRTGRFRGDRFEGFLRRLRHEDRLPGVREPLRDLGDLFGGFPRTEHDFGKTATERSMVIDFREPEIFEAQDPELLGRLVGGDLAALDVFQDLAQTLGAHGGEFSPMKALSAPRSRHALPIASTKNGTYSRSFTQMTSSHGCPGVARYAE